MTRAVRRVKDKTKIKPLILRGLGLILCTVPVFWAVISYFPLWREAGGGRLLSGGALLLVILAWVPLFRFIKRLIASPSAYMMWLIIFIVFFMLSKIAEEMTVISFVGFVGNALGAVCFKFSEKSSERKDG